ncbi:translation initiation factor eIF 4e-like domain-containing protein [Microdochium bolleyi]|uniref:Translation initiation factor eIF 4e-like domain-containing protein n=1 Tax=Microdochium bolleyi TaxID=196109 RepID=A0A136J812_9PEZI|nr:translation initiation factor eIF 4e-like domain-containing protein [Microdochium bolleyi]
MDNKDTIWNRRTNAGSLSLSTGQNESPSAPRDYSSLSRRSGPGSSHGGRGPIPFGGAQTPGGTLASPGGAGGVGAGNAFGLGSGAFGFAGATSAKTPKTPGNPYEREWGALAGSKTPSSEKTGKDAFSRGKPSMSSISEITGKSQGATSHPLCDVWAFWFRPPISKANGYIEYERSLHQIAQVATVEEFKAVYAHLWHPSDIPEKSDYHLFKKGIRPVWEDDVNKQGGKWVVHLKKGVANRFWEETLFACIGDQFGDDRDEVCGVVLSVRNGEDTLSIWLRQEGASTFKIRDTLKQCLTSIHTGPLNFVWKSHDASKQKAAHTHLHNENNANKRTHHNKGQRQTQDEPRA